MDLKDKQSAKVFANRVINDLGGTSKVATLCQTSLSAVAQWRENGIPDARLMFLKLARPDIFSQTAVALLSDRLVRSGNFSKEHHSADAAVRQCKSTGDAS